MGRLSNRDIAETGRVGEMLDQIGQNLGKAPEVRTQSKRVRKALADYDYFSKTYLEELFSTTMPQFHIDDAWAVLRLEHPIYCSQKARGMGKSTNLLGTLLFRMAHGQPTRAPIICATEDAAKRHMAALKKQLEYNELLAKDFAPGGSWKDPAHWTAEEVELSGGHAFWVFGMQSSNFRGLKTSNNQRPNMLVFDDADRTDVVRNKQILDHIWNYVVWGDIYPMLGADGGPIVWVGNPIAPDCLATRMADMAQAYVSRMPILDEDGHPTWPEHYTPERIAQIKEVTPYAQWMTEYMLEPMLSDSTFDEDWFHWHDAQPWSTYERLVLYLDPSYRDHKNSDYRAASLWGAWKNPKKGGKWTYDKIDCYLQRGSSELWIDWIIQTYQAMPDEAKAKLHIYTEGMFNQPMIADLVQRKASDMGIHIPIIPDRRQKFNKENRIANMEVIYKQGIVRWNETKRQSRHFQTALAQYMNFNPARRKKNEDDGPDCDEGALYILQQHTRVAQTGGVRRDGLGARRKNKSVL